MKQYFIAIKITLLITAFFGFALSASPKPSVASNGMVVSSEPVAAEVGLKVLKDGGNAVDATIAALATLNVTEGYNSGMGGGCFIMVYWAETGEVYAIDGRERAPLKADRNLYINNKDGSVIAGLSTEGVTAVATPGQPAALNMILNRWATLKLTDLFQPAITVADTGFIISRTYAERLIYSRNRLLQYESSKEIFFPENDTLPLGFGDRLVQKKLAGFLEKLSVNGMEWFYNSSFSKELANYIRKNGGYLKAKDLKSYSAIERQPVSGNFRGYDIYSMPPPSSGGIHVIQILEILEPFYLRYHGPGSSETIHLLAEAMKCAFADRAHYLGDPDFVNVPVAGLLDSGYLDDHRSMIKSYQSTDISGPGALPSNESNQTTHISVIDKSGNMVAITASLNTSFGSAAVLPGWGLLLNNHMDDFSLQPGVPNYYGLVGSEANAIEPGKRPLSSMSPTIVLHDGKPAGVFGSPGGPRIITTVVQTFLNIVEFGMDVQTAIDFPRIHHQWKPDVIFIETGIPEDVLVNLKAKEHFIYQGGTWSSAQCIWIEPETGFITGGTDSRTEGKAAGY